MNSTPTGRFPLLAATVSLAFIAMPAVYPVAAVAQAAGQADKVQAMNGQVLQLQSEVRKARAAVDGAAPRAQAKQVLAARAKALGELIITDPTAAERLAFPASVLGQIADTFPEAAVYLEQRGAWQGEFEYLVEDNAAMSAHRDIFRLRGAAGSLDIGFVGKAPPVLKSGQKVNIVGVRSGKSLAAVEVQVTDAALDGASTTTAATGATCSPTGAQSLVSILVNLPSYKLPSATTADFVRGVLMGNAFAGASQSSPDWSVDDFWRQNSDGKTFVDTTNTTVVGPVSVASNFNTDSTGAAYCDYYGLQDAVFKAVDGQVDFRRYSRVQIVFPGNGACSWSGMANVGCRSLSTAGDGSFTASVSWVQAGSMTTRAKGVQLSTHEMGHNLGLRHAQSRDFGSEPLGGLGVAGSISEYGDPHSTMGQWNFGFYASSHAANTLGWLASGANYQVVESAGTYTIQNYEARPAGLKALKVRRGTGNDAWLWIESRQSTGIYSSQLNSSLSGGALIHYQDSSTGDYSNLLDFTGGTTSFSDAALPVGTTWTDPYSNVSVTVSSVTPTATSVIVNYGALPCTTAVPTVTASPTGVTTQYGKSTQFAVTVQNNSSSGCAAEAFDLAGVVPSGWTGTFAATTLTVSPGATGQTTMSVAVPSPYTLGTYSVTSAATSKTSGLKKSSIANVTVTEPTYRLSLSISGTGSVAFSSPVKTCTSSCTADYSVSAGTPVTLTATAGSRNVFSGWTGACSGTSPTCTVTMGSDKAVAAKFSKTTGKK